MTLQPYYPRRLQGRLEEALSDTPVVLVSGPRQSGKTTLVRHAQTGGLRYLTLDDALVRTAALADPEGLVRSLDRAIIDEVQRAPGLLLAIKRQVDEDRRPGRFLLTGSADLLSLPAAADSLAGRMENLLLLPLSQGELHGRSTNWIEAAFSGTPLGADGAVVGTGLVEVVLGGGYPEALARPTPRRRQAWLRQYVDALLQRDVRELAQIEKLDQMPRLLRALAQVAGQTCNYARLGGQIGLDGKTVARYLGIFEQMYLLRRLEAWSGNRLTRLIKAPKLHFLDSGLLAALQELQDSTIAADRDRLGAVLECFVCTELLKHAHASASDYRLLHYRDVDGFEVDLVIENAAGQVVGVEVKAAATVTTGDLRGLRKLQAAAGEQFLGGFVLYDGDLSLPLGKSLWALPLSSLWGR